MSTFLLDDGTVVIVENGVETRHVPLRRKANDEALAVPTMNNLEHGPMGHMPALDLPLAKPVPNYAGQSGPANTNALPLPTLNFGQGDPNDHGQTPGKVHGNARHDALAVPSMAFDGK